MIPPLRPLVLFLLMFLAGLLPALRFAPSPIPWLFLSALALLGALSIAGNFGRGRSTEALLLGAFAAAGAALGAQAGRSAVSDCRARIPHGERVQVEGVLEAGWFVSADSTSPGALLPLAQGRLSRSGAVCSGAARVLLTEPRRPVPAGSRLVLSGEWVEARRRVVESRWPRDPALGGYVRVDSVLGVRAPSFARDPLLAARGRVEQRLHRLFPAHFGVVDALLLGRRERMDPAVRDRFARAGLAHLLAISGMHVGLLAGVLLVAGQALRMPRRRVMGLTIALTAAYLALIGAPAPALRAGIMVALVLLAQLLQRPAAALPMIAAAALPLLAWRPLVVTEPGFQLSFAGVLGILLAQRTLGRELRSAPLHPAARGLLDSVLVSFAAFAATAPITAHHFGTVAPVAVLANLPAVPLMSLALTGVVAALAASPVVPPLAGLLADGAGFLLDLLDRVTTLAAAVPLGHVGVARPGTGWWVGAGAAALAATLSTRRLRPVIRVAATAGAVAATALAWPAVGRGAGGWLEVHFLDVGQGDAVAVRSPAGRWLLVDAGPRIRDHDAGERRVLPFLRAQGVRRLEALILTHPDADHIGGAPAVLRGMAVGQVIEPGLPVGKGVYLEMLAEVERRGIRWSAARSGRVLSLDGVELHFLWPEPGALDGVPEANHISAVVRLTYGGFAVLLPGDVSAEVEERLAEKHGSGLRAQILKAGHHGSATSSSDTFLDAVDPELVVISSGRDNRYGHPAPVVMERLARRPLRVARTDREGTVSLRVEPGSAPRWQRMEP